MRSKPLKNEFKFDVPKIGTKVTLGTEMCPPMRWPSGYGIRLAIVMQLIRIQLLVVLFTANSTDASPREINSRLCNATTFELFLTPDIIEFITEQTNLYAKRGKNEQNFYVDMPEM